MSLSKKDLKDIKHKLRQSNPQYLNNIRKTTTTIKNHNSEDVIYKNRISTKKKIKWNFKVNDIVQICYGNSYSKQRSVRLKINQNEIGLIVSDYIYQSQRVEKNNFFVLVNGAVNKYDGRYLRKI